MKIIVTKRDIKKGRTMSCKKCPVARATRRATSYKKSVAVGTYLMNIGKKEFRVPKRASNFIKNFDLGCYKVRPFEFKLGRELPSD